MISPLVRELAVTGAPVRVLVAVTCRVMKIAKAPFYRWLTSPVTDRGWSDTQLVKATVDAHDEAPTFGYRLIADELEDLGFDASERRVWWICSENQILSTTITRHRGGKSTRQGPPAHDDLVQRRFSAATPNMRWLTDITEHWTGEGKLYCCVPSRTCSPAGSLDTRSLIGWPQISPSPRSGWLFSGADLLARPFTATAEASSEGGVSCSSYPITA